MKQRKRTVKCLFALVAAGAAAVTILATTLDHGRLMAAVPRGALDFSCQTTATKEGPATERPAKEKADTLVTIFDEKKYNETVKRAGPVDETLCRNVNVTVLQLSFTSAECT